MRKIVIKERAAFARCTRWADKVGNTKILKPRKGTFAHKAFGNYVEISTHDASVVKRYESLKEVCDAWSVLKPWEVLE